MRCLPRCLDVLTTPVQLGLIKILAGKLHVPYDEIDIRKTLLKSGCHCEPADTAHRY